MNRRLDLIVPVTQVDHARGSLRPRVTIVEYGDFQCSICRAAEPGVRIVLERFSSQMQLIYRHFVMEGAHPRALVAAEAA
jgi:protein-disulfide isomerase